jgi:hypothetical protein
MRPPIAVLAAVAFCLVDLVRADHARHLPKGLWALLLREEPVGVPRALGCGQRNPS